jgi:hypothetical protein
MPGYDRKFDEDGMSYTVVPDEGGPSHEPETPGTYSYSSSTPGTYSYASQAPSPPRGYSSVPSSPSTSAPGPKSPTSGPTDDEIDALLAGGGRLSSRAMRQLELKVRAREGTSPQLPKGPALSETDRKREKIMSRIPKTKTKDSEGGDLGFVNDDSGGLAGKKLVSHYEGESKSLAWRAGNREKKAEAWGMDPDSPEFEQRWQELRSKDHMTTHYDEQDYWTKDRSRLKEKSNGKVKTTHDKRQWSNADEHGWVMEPSTGNIHTFDGTNVRANNLGTKRQFTHHSSPLAGGAVAGAGMMKIEDKHITEVTDESGHYRPEGEYTYQAVNAMAKRGLLDRKAKRDDRDQHQSGRGNLSARVTLGGAVGRDGRPGKGWLNDEEGIYKDDLTLPYQAFLQTKGNERQARAKKSMQDELLSKVPKAKAHPGTKAEPKQGASSLGGAPSPYTQVDDAPPVYVEDQTFDPGVYVEDDDVDPGVYVEDQSFDPGVYVEDDDFDPGVYVEDDDFDPGVYVEDDDVDDDDGPVQSMAGYFTTGEDGELKRID